MSSQNVSHPGQFEPLLPQTNLAPLFAAARALSESSQKLQSSLPLGMQRAVRALVRQMSAYYSHLIEDEEAHPLNIDLATKGPFSNSPEISRRQRMALAHMETEAILETRLPPGETPNFALSSKFLISVHKLLYTHYRPEVRITSDARLVVPGALRQFEVSVGRHVPPAVPEVPLFLARMDEIYPFVLGLERGVCAIACAHHRATWVHPFEDGNGRATRLQSHCAMLPVSGGLWSISRGLARQKGRYFNMLAEADAPRAGDLDGRGNLSERALRQWCSFFIEVAQSEVSFMSEMLNLDKLNQRLSAIFAEQFQANHFKRYAPGAARAIHLVVAIGQVSRDEFIGHLGMPKSDACQVLADLIEEGFLVSLSAEEPLTIGFPLDYLDRIFPGMYPEASTTTFDY